MIKRRASLLTLLLTTLPPLLHATYAAQPPHNTDIVIAGTSPLQEPLLRMMASFIGSLPHTTPQSTADKFAALRLFNVLYMTGNDHIKELLCELAEHLRTLTKVSFTSVRAKDKQLIMLLEESKSILRATLHYQQLNRYQPDVDALMEHLYNAISPTLKSLQKPFLIGGVITIAGAATLLSIFLTSRWLKKKSNPYTNAMVALTNEFDRHNRSVEAVWKHYGYTEAWGGNFDPKTDMRVVTVTLKDGSTYPDTQLRDKTKDGDVFVEMPISLGKSLALFFSGKGPAASFFFAIANAMHKEYEKNKAIYKRFNVDLTKETSYHCVTDENNQQEWLFVGEMPRDAATKEREEILAFNRQFDFDTNTGRVLVPRTHGIGYAIAQFGGNPNAPFHKNSEAFMELMNAIRGTFSKKEKLKTS